MGPLRLLHVLALAAIALVALSSGPVPVNAVVADRAQVARRVHGHDAIARRKRSDPSSTGRCKTRPPSSSTSYQPPPPTSTSTPSPTSTSSSAPPSTTTTTSGSGSGGKFGLAWANDNQYLGGFAILPSVAYLYTWSAYLPSTLSNYPNVQGMIMLWGRDQVSDFQSKAVPGYARYALGMNEPNEPSQSNMGAQEAMQLWMQYINPLKQQGYTLLSPACTDDDAGMQWYNQFFSLCDQQNCQVDGIAFHAYTNDSQHVIDYATQLYNTFHRPIWITEFADTNFADQNDQPSMADVWNYAGRVRDFCTNTGWVMACFPFGAMSDLQGVDSNNNLLNPDGTPTALAYYYYG